MIKARKKIKLIKEFIDNFETELSVQNDVYSPKLKKRIRMKINILKDIEAEYTAYLESDLGQLFEDDKLKKWLKKNSSLSPIN